MRRQVHDAGDKAVRRLAIFVKRCTPRFEDFVLLAVERAALAGLRRLKWHTWHKGRL